jgi:ABC-type multidrug transport system fused ATPase/permease subunit
MATLLAGRTTFMIAHRLSTIRRAHLILLLEDGRIIERGTHEDLMAAGGVYHDMVRRQMQAGLDAGVDQVLAIPAGGSPPP